MRKLLMPLLLASALAPAAASAEDVGSTRGQRAHSERGDHSSDSNASSDNRPQRTEHSIQADRPARIERAERPARVERAESGAQFEGSARPARIERVDRPEPARIEQVERSDHPASIERVVRISRQRDNERRIERPVERQIVQTEPAQEVRAIEPAQQERSTERSGSRLVDGIRSGVRDHDELQRRERERDRNRWRDRDGHRWSGDWRHDHRYDWWNYRNRYGSLFRLGRYYDPYGWNYRRWSIGFTLWPSYYGSHYWLNDPWHYRLPPAYGPYRWVRYYDDALLVNIYTGQVVDVIHNFFW